MTDPMETARGPRQGHSDAWQTKVQEWMRMPFPLPWIVIATVLFGIGYAIAWLSGDSFGAIRFLAVRAALIAAIANSVVLFERFLDNVADAAPDLLDESAEKATAWIRGWYRFTFWSYWTVLPGVGLGVLCVWSGDEASASLFGTVLGKAYFYAITFVIGFLGGSMFWTMLGIAGLAFSVGADRKGGVRITPHIIDVKTSVLRRIWTVLWKVSLTAALLYVLGVSMTYASWTEMDTFRRVRIVFFGVFIIVYFIVPQVNIRRTLVRIRRGRLEDLVQQIDRTFDCVSRQPTPRNIKRLHDLCEVKDIVRGKSGWSFGVKELLLLLGSVLIPLLALLLPGAIEDYKNRSNKEPEIKNNSKVSARYDAAMEVSMTRRPRPAAQQEQPWALRRSQFKPLGGHAAADSCAGQLVGLGSGVHADGVTHEIRQLRREGLKPADVALRST